MSAVDEKGHGLAEFYIPNGARRLGRREYGRRGADLHLPRWFVTVCKTPMHSRTMADVQVRRLPIIPSRGLKILFPASFAMAQLSHSPQRRDNMFALCSFFRHTNP